MLNRPTIRCCILAKSPQPWTCRCRAVGLLSIFLAILEAAQDPSGLALLEFAILISFNCEHPPVCDEVLGLELADLDEVEDIIVKPGLDFSRLGFNEELGMDLELF